MCEESPLRVKLVYCRQFYPSSPEKIRKTPYEHLIAEDFGYEEDLMIEELLEEIKKQHGIPYEIRLVSNEYFKRRYGHLPIHLHEEVYGEIIRFKRKLMIRGKRDVERDLRNSSGTISLGWTLIVKVNDEVVWYETFPGDIIRFLEGIVYSGVNYIKSYLMPLSDREPLVVGDIRGDTAVEEELLRKLVFSGIFNGYRIRTQVPLGTRVHGKAKYADMVCEKPGEVWIIEAKEEPNWEAVGQVICYKVLYEEDNYLPEEIREKTARNINLGIVVKNTDPVIEHCCRRLGIRIFKFT